LGYNAERDLSNFLARVPTGECWVQKGNAEDLAQAIEMYGYGQEPMKKIMIPPGIYDPTAPLEIPHCAHLEAAIRTPIGASPRTHGVVIRNSYNLASVIKSKEEPTFNATLKGLMLDGRRTKAGNTQGHGIYGSFKYCTFDHLFIQDCDESAMKLEQTGSETNLWENTIRHCTLRYCDEYGLILGEQISDSKVWNCLITEMGNAALLVEGNGGNQRITLTTLEVSEYGAYLNGSAATTHFNQCSIDQNQKDGVYWHDVNRGSIIQ